MKRGISAVITTLLLVAFTIFLAGGIYVWIQTSLSNSQREASINQACSLIKFKAGDICDQKITVYDMKTGVSKIEDRLTFDVKNIGLNPINEGFILSLDYNDGSSLTLSDLGSGILISSDAKKLVSDVVPNIGSLEKIGITSKVNVSGEIFACNNNVQYFNWGGGSC